MTNDPPVVYTGS